MDIADGAAVVVLGQQPWGVVPAEERRAVSDGRSSCLLTSLTSAATGVDNLTDWRTSSVLRSASSASSLASLASGILVFCNWRPSSVLLSSWRSGEDRDNWARQLGRVTTKSSTVGTLLFAVTLARRGVSRFAELVANSFELSTAGDSCGRRRFPSFTLYARTSPTARCRVFGGDTLVSAKDSASPGTRLLRFSFYRTSAWRCLAPQAAQFVL